MSCLWLNILEEKYYLETVEPINFWVSLYEGQFAKK